jgi:hypothetical protein
MRRHACRVAPKQVRAAPDELISLLASSATGAVVAPAVVASVDLE